MNDTKQAKPLQTENIHTIKIRFQAELEELISQHDDGSHSVGFSIIDALSEVLHKLQPAIEDRGMSELGL